MADASSDGARTAQAAISGAQALVPAGTQTVGLRPEHAQIAADGPIRMQVSQVEQLGATSLLHGTVGSDTPFEIVIHGQTRSTGGETVQVAMPRAHVHCFDAQGLRL